MRILLSILLLTAWSANAQPLWRNFFTTNQNPRLTVVAGSNSTVQASTVGVNQRVFTVNGMQSGTDATNGLWTAVGVATNQAYQSGTNTAGTYKTDSTNINVLKVASSNIVGTVTDHNALTNGDTRVITFSDTITATNSTLLQGKHSFVTNFTAVPSIQVYNCNGTNQLITLPNCTSTAPWKIYRFVSTNGHGKFTLTNANGAQTIRDGTSLSFINVGIGSPAFYHDGAHWWVASKSKIVMPVAQFSTSTNVPLTLANTSYPVTFDSTDFNNSQGIALGLGTNGFHSKMWITNSGQYEFGPSVVQSYNGNDTIRFWFRKFGTNIANSSTPSKGQNGSIRVITVPFIVNVTEPTPFEIWAESDSTGESLLAQSASGNYPAGPSVICPVKKISDTWP